MIDNLECPSHLEQIRNRAAEKDRDRAIAEMSEWVKRSAIAEMSEWVKRSNRQVNTIDGLNKELEAAKAEIQRLRDYLSTADEADGPLMYTSDHDKILAREIQKLRGELAMMPTDPNYEYKHRPVVSTDCSFGDHKSCEGSEPVLWPDGETTTRMCSCACHNFDPNSIYVGERKL
jgi:hypothetical protein